jgi:hypothetical protein
MAKVLKIKNIFLSKRLNSDVHILLFRGGYQDDFPLLFLQNLFNGAHFSKPRETLLRSLITNI